MSRVTPGSLANLTAYLLSLRNPGEGAITSCAPGGRWEDPVSRGGWKLLREVPKVIRASPWGAVVL